MKHLPRLFALLLLSGMVLLLGSCDSGGDANGEEEPPPPEAFDRPAMLANIGNNMVIPAYQALQTAIDALQEATDAFAANPSANTLEAAQQALKAARLAWQDANLFQFGPAESVALRAALNTYPTDADLIENNVASGNYVLGSIANRAAGGFPTLDYLLHGMGSNPEETLAKYTTDAGAAQRIAYVQDNVDFIKTNTDDTLNDWLASGGNYIGTFLSADKAGVDAGSSLGELSNALILHYERFLRDGKIGIPAGVRSAGVPRPRSTEAFYGGYSVELAIANVKAIERLFLGTGLNGTDGIGLDENLQALGATDLSNDIKTTLTATVTALEGLNDPLSTQIETDVDAVTAAFTTMQQLVVLLKADMASVLGITITFQDNDGD